MKNYTYPLILLVLFALTAPLAIRQIQQKQEIREHAQTAVTALYVSANGSGDCTQASPCSFATADGKATAGTTVHVAPGDYGSVVISKSGAQGNNIRWVSDTKWGAKMSGDANSTVEISAQFVDFEGFDVTGGANTQNLIKLGSQSRAIGNHVHDSPRGCDSNGGIETGGNTEVIGNFIENIGAGSGGCNLFHGIYFDTGDVIKNNVVVNVPNGSGIQSWHDTAKATIVNNTVVHTGNTGIYLGSDTGVQSGSYVANNISIDNAGNGAGDKGTAKGNTYVNNLYFNNKDGSELLVDSTSTGKIEADPQFVNPAGGDYHLKPGSPAIDKGAPNQAPTTDFDGHPRPQGAGIDIGAFESGTAGGAAGTSSAPNQPSGIVSPPFVALAPCPTCVNPSISPDLSGVVEPSIGEPNPSEVIQQPGASIAPCDASLATDNSVTDAKKHKKHSKHSGKVNGGMDQLLKLLIELLNKILQLLGGGKIELPSTTPGEELSGQPLPSTPLENPAPCPSQ
jgi:hypothetical protein